MKRTVCRKRTQWTGTNGAGEGSLQLDGCTQRVCTLPSANIEHFCMALKSKNGHG